MQFNKPTPLTLAGIKDVVNRFANAAVVLHRAGWGVLILLFVMFKCH